MSEVAWRWDRQLHGIIPPLISPLDDAGVPDAGAMAALVDHVIGGGCSGLFMLGAAARGPGSRPRSVARWCGRRRARPPGACRCSPA
jgi:hypothetical protein